MKVNSDFFQNACKTYGFTEDAVITFLNVAKRIDADSDFGERFEKIRKSFLFPKAHNLPRAVDRLTSLAEEKGVHPYTLHTVFLIACSSTLRLRYKRAGLPDELFLEAMKDLGYKVRECKELKGIDGTFVATWNHRWFDISRFTLGRFQFEDGVLAADYKGKNGVEYPKGTQCVHIHIPSSGQPMNEEVRLASYKKAYEFYQDKLIDGVLVLHCTCWMLNPDNEKMLPEHSNILGFYRDFDVYDKVEKEDFNDGERIYGGKWYGKVKDLPEDTGLQRAYKKWLMDGKKLGVGRGVILFDGEKIIR